MDSMIERVARAIAKTDHGGRVADEGYWQTACTGSNSYRAMARAALEAMREPTHAMLWSREMPDIGPDEIRVLWQAMIDAALTSETEG